MNLTPLRTSCEWNHSICPFVTGLLHSMSSGWSMLRQGGCFGEYPSNRCELVSRCGFDLVLMSAVIRYVEHLSLFIGHWYIFFGEVSVQVLCPF